MFSYSSIKKYVNSQHSTFTNNCTPNLSHVITLGVLDKHLSLMDTCHVVEAVHLCKYRPRARLQTTVGKRKTSHRSHQCLFICQIENYFWVSTTRCCQCLAAGRLAECTSGVDAVKITRQVSGKCTRVQICAEYIHQLWEQYVIHTLDVFYSARFLARLSNTPAL
jgi:hypothetical protein